MRGLSVARCPESRWRALKSHLWLWQCGDFGDPAEYSGRGPCRRPVAGPEGTSVSSPGLPRQTTANPAAGNSTAMAFQPWGMSVQNASHRARVKGHRAAPSVGSRGRSIRCPLQLPKVPPAPFSPSRPAECPSVPSLTLLPSSHLHLHPPVPSSEALVTTFRASRVTQEHLPILGPSVVKPAKSPLPLKLHTCGFWGSRFGVWGGCIGRVSPPQQDPVAPGSAAWGLASKQVGRFLAGHRGDCCGLLSFFCKGSEAGSPAKDEMRGEGGKVASVGRGLGAGPEGAWGARLPGGTRLGDAPGPCGMQGRYKGDHWAPPGLLPSKVIGSKWVRELRTLSRELQT